MRARILAWSYKLSVVLASGYLLQAGCARTLQREIEVLFAPAANPTLLYNSWVFNQLGPQFVAYFNRIF